jgi:formylglycine-generating enzyme required for sulfatase activity
VPASLAEPGYLADWPAAGSAGSTADLERPVTSVSWFAARAYCAALGKRLPTVDEWELAAAASETSRDATSDLAYRRRLAALYAARRPGPPPAVGRTIGNVYGVHDLHGLVWEWTSDFNATVSEHPAHAAHAAHAAGSPDHAGHPLYCASSAIGATDPTDYPAFARAAVRGGLTARSTVSGVGFRCAAAQPI